MSTISKPPRPETSLQARLLKSARDAFAAAQRLAPGRERAELLKQAKKAEALAKAAVRLNE